MNGLLTVNTLGIPLSQPLRNRKEHGIRITTTISIYERMRVPTGSVDIYIRIFQSKMANLRNESSNIFRDHYRNRFAITIPDVSSSSPFWKVSNISIPSFRVDVLKSNLITRTFSIFGNHGDLRQLWKGKRPSTPLSTSTAPSPGRTPLPRYLIILI